MLSACQIKKSFKSFPLNFKQNVSAHMKHVHFTQSATCSTKPVCLQNFNSFFSNFALALQAADCFRYFLLVSGIYLNMVSKVPLHHDFMREELPYWVPHSICSALNQMRVMRFSFSPTALVILVSPKNKNQSQCKYSHTRIPTLTKQQVQI